MRHAAGFLALSVALATACIGVPGDAEQIRALARERAASLRRDDRAALYRLHDLDFRAVCPFDRFRELPTPEPARVLAVRDITTRGVRASALLEIERAGAAVIERRHFVKDAGRWYLYEDATPCLESPTSKVREWRR